MTEDTSWVGPAMQQRVPWVKAVGITFGDVTARRVVAHLPDDPQLHNHVGGPHAAMIFGLGETASGAVGLAAFGSVMDRATPLVVSSEIAYHRLARGPLTAVAELTRPAEEVLAELAGGQRPEFTVTVGISDTDARETTRMVVRWTLLPNR